MAGEEEVASPSADLEAASLLLTYSPVELGARVKLT